VLAGASGVVIYNEGQEGRTETFPGSVEQPEFTLPAVFAHYAIGRELDEIKQHREVRVRIRTATSIEFARPSISWQHQNRKPVAEGDRGRSPRFRRGGAGNQ
jgi:hypothetical protein